MPAFQPYWGKLAVRNDRGDRGNVGIIRSPVRASILPDQMRHWPHFSAPHCGQACSYRDLQMRDCLASPRTRIDCRDVGLLPACASPRFNGPMPEPAPGKRSLSAKCAPPAFAGFWSIARITNAAIGRRSAATVGRTTFGCPTLSRASSAMLCGTRGADVRSDWVSVEACT
jgi:hypothetical protein